ncbi:UPF0687 protein C20orf27-like [Silurus meridionalis]|nr:UPF0687 protein C20orf27-like [Silurus meridionalis]
MSGGRGKYGGRGGVVMEVEVKDVWNKAGFLKILHKYEITFLIPQVPTLGKDSMLSPALRATPKPRLRATHIVPCPEGGVKVVCEYSAQQEGVVQDELTLINRSRRDSSVKVRVHARVMEVQEQSPATTESTTPAPTPTDASTQTITIRTASQMTTPVESLPSQSSTAPYSSPAGTNISTTGTQNSALIQKATNMSTASTTTLQTTTNPTTTTKNTSLQTTTNPTTTTTATSTTAATSTPATVIYVEVLRFTLDMTFTQDLENALSVAFITLATLIEEQLDFIFQLKYGKRYSHCRVNSFQKGSIKVNSTLFFIDTIPNNIDIENTLVSAWESNTTSLLLINGTVFAEFAINSGELVLASAALNVSVMLKIKLKIAVALEIDELVVAEEVVVDVLGVEVFVEEVFVDVFGVEILVEEVFADVFGVEVLVEEVFVDVFGVEVFVEEVFADVFGVEVLVEEVFVDVFRVEVFDEEVFVDVFGVEVLVEEVFVDVFGVEVFDEEVFVDVFGVEVFVEEVFVDVFGVEVFVVGEVFATVD